MHVMHDFRLTLNTSLMEPITMGVVGSGKPLGPTSPLGSVSAHSFAISVDPSSKATDRPWKPGFSYSSQLDKTNITISNPALSNVTRFVTL